MPNSRIYLMMNRKVVILIVGQDVCFSVLHRARDKIHLNVLKAIYIAIDHPSICRQKSSHILNIFGEILETGVS